MAASSNFEKHKIFIYLCMFLLLFLAFKNLATAGIFTDKQGKTFETKGTATIIREGAFTIGVEKKDIPVPTYINIEIDKRFSDISHDSDSGKWTKCRLPLKGDKSFLGAIERILVFDCKPTSFF